MYIIVLGDGETWTTLEGCKIVYINTDVNDDTSDERIRQAANGSDRLGDEVVTTFK